MTLYRCCVDAGEKVVIEADSPKEAAEEYVSGYAESEESTYWITVYVDVLDGPEEGLYEHVKLAIEPTVPPCAEGYEDHDWQSPFELLGGIRENPGVWGSGGGVRIHEVCWICGCEKVTNTWGQDPTDGEQGLTSETYSAKKYNMIKHRAERELREAGARPTAEEGEEAFERVFLTAPEGEYEKTHAWELIKRATKDEDDER